MSVKVNIPSYLKPYTNGAQVVEVDGSTVSQCLHHLVKQYPRMKKMLLTEEDNLPDYTSIYVDGEFAFGNDLARPVQDGDELHIVFMIGGG